MNATLDRLAREYITRRHQAEEDPTPEAVEAACWAWEYFADAAEEAGGEYWEDVAEVGDAVTITVHYDRGETNG